MAKKVSLINMKGGVGKSTLTVNLAWCFALRHDKKVLVVDLDPQFNASQYLLGETGYARFLDTGRPTIWDLFERNTRSPFAPTTPVLVRDAIHNRESFPGGGRIDLIPSRLDLAFSLKSPYQQKEAELGRSLAEVEAAYDLVLIDCAPTESLLTTAAYLASDWLLVPVRPEHLSSVGLPLLTTSLNDFRGVYPSRSPAIAGIVFNATTDYAPEERLAKDVVRQLAAQKQWHLFENTIPYSRSFPASSRIGLSVFNTPYTRRRTRRRFEIFVEEFARRIQL